MFSQYKRGSMIGYQKGLEGRVLISNKHQSKDLVQGKITTTLVIEASKCANV